MAHTLEGVELTFSIKEKTLGEFFFKKCEQYGDRICQIDGTENEKKTETYSSVKSRSVRVAVQLQKRGVTSNDVITFCSSNTLDNTIPMIGASFLGAKISNLELSLSVRHTKHLLNLVTPKIIFVDEVAVDLIEESLKDAAFQTEIVVFGESDKYTKFSDLMKMLEDEEKFRPVEVNPDDIALMFFSSGTTGLPKAICHSHVTLLYSVCINCQYGLCEASFHFTTFYWMTAVMLWISSFAVGSYRVFARNPTTEDVFRIIETCKVGCIFAAPFLTYNWTNFENFQKYDTSSLKLLVLGGTPINSTQMQEVRKVFKNTFVILGYGMSEIGLISGFDPKTDRELANQNPTSCGKVVASVKLKVVDPETETPLSQNEKGEIRIWCPSLMKGYYNLPSSEVFDEDNFLKTGDIGYYDKDGCVYVIDRIKEMFKYKSWHIVPSALETVLLEHPGIKEAVVFGLPSGADGDVPAACVVLTNGVDIDENDIDEFLKEKVADRERLRGGVTFIKAIPRTPTGKVVRKEIRNFVINKKL